MNARCYGALGLALTVTAAGCSASETNEGTPRVEEVAFSATNVDSLELAAELSFKHLYETNPQLLAGVDEVWTQRVNVDSLGMAHTRIQQTVGGVRVFGGEAIVHLEPNGAVARVTDNLVRNISVDTKPAIDQEGSIDIAMMSFGKSHRLTHEPETELVVFRHNEIDYLAWRVQLRQLDGSKDTAMPVYFIDAHTGDVILTYDNLQHVALSDADKQTYNMNRGTSYSAAQIADSSDAVALQAHENAGHTLAYYLSQHNRDSYNGSGIVVRSYVHYSNNYVNAYWDGQRLTYGDGDNVTSAPLTVLDVVAHEFSHAVTTNEANLTYQGESGALNEGTSDIMAAAVEAYVEGGITEGTFQVGEDCWLAAEALRFMYNPTQDGRSRDHYSTRYTGFDDNGGVHMNSGIANLFFYLLSQGGQHPNPARRVATVTGIGIDAAADIWYRALTTYMTSSTNFAGARTATLNATADLFGATSTQHCQVQNAWAEVGVGSPCGGTPPPPPPPGTELQNGVPVTGLSAAAGDFRFFTLQVPAGATNLRFNMSGGTGDADLYVKFGSQPTTTSYDCRPYKSGNTETCSFATPSAGTYHVGIRAYTSYSSVSLTGAYDGGGGGGTGWSGSATPNLALVDNGQACSTLDVTASGNASEVKLDVTGTHTYRSVLRATLEHNGTSVQAFPTGTFANGSGTFTVSARAVAGLSGSATGTWRLCIVDTDGFSDTGTLQSWSVHN